MQLSHESHTHTDCKALSALIR